jgi:alpha-galactosidase
VRDEIGRSNFGPRIPGWLSTGKVTLPGSVLGAVGLQIPPLWPAQALVLHLTAMDAR